MRIIVLLLALTASAGAQPQNHRWGSLWLYEPMKPVLARGAKITVIYQHCDVDQTRQDVQARTCHPGDVHALRKTSGMWKWLRATFVVEERAATADELAGEVPRRPDLFVFEEDSVTTMVDEWVSFGCGHETPCDPAMRSTGRKVRGTQTYGGDPLPPGYVGGIGPIVERIGARLVSAQVDILLVTRTKHDAPVHVAFDTPYRAKETLAYLATATDPDPDVRLALAYDRVLIAARARDATTFATAYPALVAELQGHDPHSPIVQVASEQLALFERISKGELGFVAPLGLDAYVSYEP
jgi:hypothetical protein